MRILLVNMRFAALNFPSLALTQIQSVLRRRFGESASADVLYIDRSGGQAIVVDTRTDDMLEHPLSAVDEHIPTILTKPPALVTLERETGKGTAEALANLRLVFEKRGRDIGLVLPEQSAAMTIETIYGFLYGADKPTPQLKRLERRARPGRRAA